MSVPRIPGMTDEELLTYVMREAQLVLAEHIERRVPSGMRLEFGVAHSPVT